ncbi:hypothetical protein FBY03_111114 [Pseudomonas sp. SJZ079]|uniref:hypothetical protein n=1 Tax=Pseudomonas sp. SJZ079 TaxID=2572887 RepID=UPI00119B4324|nr:hypothetical protein [Pseudomonas sp. SJZ079]TWC35066.1 hypothetical protein FBY03_111114 [Pseudomonas sp. SJZ079]
MRDKIFLLCLILTPHLDIFAASLPDSEVTNGKAAAPEAAYTLPLYLLQKDGVLVPVQFGEGTQPYSTSQGNVARLSIPKEWELNENKLSKQISLQRNAINELKTQLDNMKKKLESYEALEVRVKALESGAK